MWPNKQEMRKFKNVPYKKIALSQHQKDFSTVFYSSLLEQ